MDRLPLAVNRSMFVAAMLLVNSGCVGLNIPSGRHHDSSAAASGEMSPGGPRRLDHALFFAKPAAGREETVSGPCVGRVGIAGGPGKESEKSLPSVPWPRFHPVPTAPAFAGPR